MTTANDDTLRQALSQVQHWRAEGRPDLAEQQIEAILSARPGEINATFLLAELRREAQRFEEAIGLLSSVTEAAPKFEAAWLELAAAQAGAGKRSAAINTLRAVVERHPQHSLAWRRLGDLLIAAGSLDKGREAFARAVQSDPFRQLMTQAMQAHNQGRRGDAEAALMSVLERDPDHVYAMVALATLALDVDDRDRADAWLERAASLTPNLDVIWRHKSRLQFHRADFAGAEASARRAVELAPDEAAAWHLLGDVQASGTSPDKAHESYLQALKLAPNQPNLHLSLGHAYKALGHRQDCEAAYRQALKMAPMMGEAFWGLADLKTFKFDEADMEAMQAALSSTGLPVPQKAYFHFALGKALEDQGRYDDAFAQYQEGNSLQAQLTPFDGVGFDRLCEGLKAQVTSLPNRAANLKAVTPIFIVGLPRSGSTLIEQILACHSGVESTMELPHLPAYANELAASFGGYLQALENMTQADLKLFGERYLSETEAFRSGKPYFIDKLPNNFVHLDLISRAIPNAIIIDTRRDPRDCGLSAFKQHFSKGQGFTYDLATMGRYYRSYAGLMDHWKALNHSRVISVVYEELVANSDVEIRRLLEACGLEFEEACLQFYESNRIVRTASSEQVRQPINTKGIGQWRKFEAHLGPLLDALGDLSALGPYKS